MDTRTKILRLDEAAAAAEAFRGEGRAVRLAAGAFDILQAAHARFLEDRCPNGEALFVAVFDDASLDRPVLPENARAQLVAALRAVDAVIVCPAARLEDLRRQLQAERVETAPDPARNIIEEVLERHR